MRIDLASQRYALLVRQLGERLGFRRGWPSTVADQLGVDRSFVWRVFKGQRGSVSDETIAKAVECLRIDPHFFADTSIESPWFGNYLDPVNAPAGESPRRSDQLSRKPQDGADVQAFVSLLLAQRGPSIAELAERGSLIYFEDKYTKAPQAELTRKVRALASSVLELPVFVAANAIARGGLSSMDEAVLSGVLVAELLRLANPERTESPRPQHEDPPSKK